MQSTLTLFTWDLEGFALADSYDEAAGRYVGLVRPGADAHFGQVTDATLLVAPSAANAQVEQATTTAMHDGANVVTRQDGIEGPAPGLPAEPAKPQNTRFFGVYRIDPERYARDLSRVSQEVLQQLAALDGTQLEVTIEIQATRQDGFPPEKMRVVLENGRTLKIRAGRLRGRVTPTIASPGKGKDVCR